MSKNVTLIKLGGSLITDKNTPKSVRLPILERLLSEIKVVMTQSPETLFILGHGSGSFAHYPAAQYGTAHGFRDNTSAFGMAVTQDSAARLNRIVVEKALEKQLPAVSFYVSNTVVTQQEKIHSFYLDALETYLNHQLLPVITGDVLPDTDQGCMIWSADTILPFLGLELQKKGWQVNQLLHVTQTNGVWKNPTGDQDGFFEIINGKNLSTVKQAMGVTSGTDVTGGMWTKIQEAHQLALQGVPSQIITGEIAGNMSKALAGEHVGTIIQP
jgi:isopentenyl phosphate kinase